MAESVTTGGGSTLPSLSMETGSVTGDYDSSVGPANSGIDLVEFLNDRLTNSFDPIPLDRSLATQAQT